MQEQSARITFSGGSGQLYRSAVDIFLSMDAEIPALAPRQQRSLGCLILAAASIEGFLNELGHNIARDPEGAPWRPASVNRFGDNWKVAEDCRATTEYKYGLALECLGGEPSDRGDGPWQLFKDLFAIRNGLVHLKSGSGEFATDFSSVVDDSSVARRLRSRNILAASDGKLDAHWVSLIQTKAAAGWCCDVASRIVRGLIELVPGEILNPDQEDEGLWKYTELRPAWQGFAPVAEILASGQVRS